MDSQRFKSSEKARVVNLAESVLNLNTVSNEPQNLQDLFKVYGNIIKKDVTEDFQKSMKNSQELIINPKFDPSKSIFKDIINHNNLREKLLDLESNNKDSLLIVPIGTSGHMISGVIKKLDDGFEFTIVNKGYRDINLYKALEQFTLSQKKMDQFVDNLKELGKKDVNEVYVMLGQLGKRENIEKQPKTEQKVDNCFIKEPENAIQFALENSSSSNGEKWNGKTTLEVHKRFISELQKQYPEHENKIQKAYNIYEINKKLDKILPNIKQIIMEAAQKKDIQTVTKISKLIGGLSEATFRKNKKSVLLFLEAINDKNSYKNLDLFLKIKSSVTKGEVELTSEKINLINQKLFDAENKFPQFSKEIKKYVSDSVVNFNGYLQNLLNKTITSIENNKPIEAEKLIDEMSKIYKESLKLSPHNLILSQKYSMMFDILKNSIDKIDTKEMPEFENLKNKINKEYGNVILNTMIISPSTANIDKIKELNIPLSEKSELKKNIKQYSGEISEPNKEKDVVKENIKSVEKSSKSKNM